MRFACLLLILTMACSHRLAPPKKWRLPPELSEISGLGIRADSFYAHNDSGDGPYLYQLQAGAATANRQAIMAGARDYEDMTQDPAGNWYIGDFGNNLRQRTDLAIYRFAPAAMTVDTIQFHYGAEQRQFDCEAMVYEGGNLHLFTKARTGRRGQYWTYHYQLPARPGEHTAILVDSLYLNHRAVTAAAIDTLNRELLLTAYNYKRVLGFFPAAASSVILISDYPEGHYLQGEVDRRNLSWAVPNQVEAVDFYDERYYYIARERTPLARARVKRKRRF